MKLSKLLVLGLLSTLLIGCGIRGKSAVSSSSTSEISEVSSSTSAPTSSTPISSEEPSSSEPSSSEPEVPEGLSPEEAARAVGTYLGNYQGEDTEHPGTYCVFGAYSSASASIADIVEYFDQIIEYVIPEFTGGEWSEAEDGTFSNVYFNAVYTVLEVYVYAETLYVDGDGFIVDEGTEGATAVDATCVEVYSYTAAA